MGEIIRDYTTGDFITTYSDDMAWSESGHTMQRLSEFEAMDVDTWEIHQIDSWPSRSSGNYSSSATWADVSAFWKSHKKKHPVVDQTKPSEVSAEADDTEDAPSPAIQPEETKDEPSQDKKPANNGKHNRIWALVFVLVGVIVIIASWQIKVKMDEAAEIRLQEAYAALQHGAELYTSGDYDGAIASFQEAQEKGVAHAKTYEDLARALKKIKQWDFEGGKRILRRILDDETTLKPYREEAQWLLGETEKIEALVAAEEAAKKKAYEQRIAQSLPFEGMEEEYIDRTALGRSALKSVYYETILGVNWKITWYFFTNWKGNVICIVRCCDGKVLSVKDYRDKPIKTLDDALPDKSTRRTQQSTQSNSDPFHASDFDHPDDFYEWYIDDFWDYTEAEEYWEKHH